MARAHLSQTILCFLLLAASSVLAEVAPPLSDEEANSPTPSSKDANLLRSFGFTLLEPFTPFSPDPSTHHSEQDKPAHEQTSTSVAVEAEEEDRDTEQTKIVNDIVSSAEGFIAHRSDYDSAIRRFRLASILGHSGAAATIGALLLAGDAHLTRDIAAGVASLRRAAGAGQPDALSMLGFLHASGLADRHGVNKNVAQALIYWTIAAETGNVYANSAMGFRHLHGIGVRKDEDLAAGYYKRAAQAIALDGRYWPTAHNFQYGEIPLASSLMTVGRTRFKESMFEGRRQPNGDDDEVYHYHRHLAETGDANSMTLLGSLLLNGGLGMRADHHQAREHLRQAAEVGHGEAHGLLGHLALREGNHSAAMTHFRYSAAQQNRIGHYALGMIFLHGLGGEKKDLSRAAMHFELAAESKQGHAKASFQLGWMYHQGQGRKKDAEKAIKQFEMSAKQGNIQSKFYLGLLLYERRGVPGGEGNRKRGLGLLKEVAEGGEWNTLFDLAHNAFDRKDMFGSLYRHSQAAHAGIELGQYNAGMMLEMCREGEIEELKHWSRERTIEEMRDLYGMSGMQGNTKSHIRAGDVSYLEQEDFRAALKSYNDSGRLGDAEGMFSVGMMVARGEGVEKDRGMALSALRLVRSKESGPAVAGALAMVGLQVQWWAEDVGEWWGKLLAETSPTRTGGGGEGRVEEDEREHGEGESEDGAKSGTGGKVRERGSVRDDAALVGGLLALLVTVLLVRSKRMARQNGDAGRGGGGVGRRGSVVS